MSVNWILSQILLDQDGVCEINHLYESYKCACSHADTVIGKNMFIDYIKSVYPNIKRARRKLNGSNQTVYLGISLKTLKDEPRPLVNFSDIMVYIPSSMELKSYSNEVLEIQQDSGCKSNGNTVYKVLSIYEHGKFDITISGKSVDLIKLNIEPSFSWDVNSVLLVFAVFDSVKLCYGLRVKASRSLIVNPAQTLGIWTYGEESYRSLRSLSCAKAVPINSLLLTCRVCQKQQPPVYSQIKIKTLEPVS